MNRLALLAFLGVAACLDAAAAPGSVVDTRHNLSVSGPGPVRSTTEQEVCIFCHAAHVPESGPALWNHVTPSAVAYKPYESAQMVARAGQPDGDSRLCLSCHDGTIALGAVHSREKTIPVTATDAGGRLREDSPARLGTDLSGAHPVSVDYDEAMAGQDLRRAVRLRPLDTSRPGESLLDEDRKVQCTSCHDPHVDTASQGWDVPPFWRGDRYQDVCATCHVTPLVDAPHGDDGLLPKGCGSCHAGHGVSGEKLLPAREENACFRCHGSADEVRARVDEGTLSVRARPTLVEAELARPHHHPVVETVGIHAAGEDLEAQTASSPRHVECVDCHAIHGAPRAPEAGGVRAVGAPASGTLGDVPEFEVCYGCHGARANLPFGHTDKSAELDPGNESYHPVELPSESASTPSLLSPWRQGDLMTCSDCHAGDRDGDTQGPHGSSWPFILKAQYTVADGTPESARAYELCYGCHSRATVLGDGTFRGHAQHVVSEKTSCYACHDSHGSPDEPALVRFGKDLRYGSVTASSDGRLDYDPSGQRCWLTCHDVDHVGLGYDP
ncbi:MAG: cytochrome c3 family protein [Myxococcota bacterium]